jgi:hypothetical protein
MNTAQLKDLVIDKIYGINDVEYLQAINKLLDINQSSGRVFNLNDKQKAMIELGKQQISNGKYITDEELENEEGKWLNE